jgi:hypothetical protein
MRLRSYAIRPPRAVDTQQSRAACGYGFCWREPTADQCGVAAEGGSVPSTAYLAWFGHRQDRLDLLLGAHRAMSASGPGSRWRTEQLNWALTLRLAGEFQGFARELHDVAVDHVVAAVAGGSPGLANVLRAGMTAHRQLDRGNATPASLGDDYLRLGLPLWPTLRARSSRATIWNRNLAALNEARNAVAHADESRLLALRTDGYPITLTTVGRWKTSLDGLVRTMDDVVSAYLGRLLGTGSPW